MKLIVGQLDQLAVAVSAATTAAAPLKRGPVSPRRSAFRKSRQNLSAHFRHILNHFADCPDLLCYLERTVSNTYEPHNNAA